MNLMENGFFRVVIGHEVDGVVLLPHAAGQRATLHIRGPLYRPCREQYAEKKSLNKIFQKYNNK